MNEPTDCPHPLETCTDGMCHMCGWRYDERRGLKLEVARLLVRQAMRDELAPDSEAWRCAEWAVQWLEGAEGALGAGGEAP